LCNILNIRVSTDHQNLTYKNYNKEHVHRWCLVLEANGPEIIYVPGHTNVIADALSRSQLTPNPRLKDNETIFLSELFGATTKDLHVIIYPLTYTTLQRSHRAAKYLQRLISSSKTYVSKTLLGVDLVVN
jgi:hypothetical protein